MLLSILDLNCSSNFLILSMIVKLFFDLPLFLWINKPTWTHKLIQVVVTNVGHQWLWNRVLSKLFNFFNEVVLFFIIVLFLSLMFLYLVIVILFVLHVFFATYAATRIIVGEINLLFVHHVVVLEIIGLLIPNWGEWIIIKSIIYHCVCLIWWWFACWGKLRL